MTVVFVIAGIFAAHAQVMLGGKSIPREKMIVYIFCGNSVMDGRFGMADRTPHPRAWNFEIYNKKYHWVPAVDPLYPDKRNKGKTCYGIKFLKKMAQTYSSYHFGIVQVAKSAAGLSASLQGNYFNYPDGNCCKEMRDAIRRIKGTVTIGGIVTDLGFPASKDKRGAEVYSREMKKLLEGLRGDIGSSAVPCFTIEYQYNSPHALCVKNKGCSKCSGETCYWEKVLSESRKVPAIVANTTLVPVDGATYADGSHFDDRGMALIAGRLAAAMKPDVCMDAAPPTAPADLRVMHVGMTSVSVNWTAARDDCGVSYYRLEDGGTRMTTVPALSATLTGLSPGSGHAITDRAVDGAGNVSPPAGPLNVITLSDDTVPPSSPDGLRIVERTPAGLTLAWSASTDNGEVVMYEIFCNGTSAGKTENTTYTVEGLSTGEVYALSVSALDAAGNRSARSKSLQAAPLNAFVLLRPRSPDTVRPGDTLWIRWTTDRALAENADLFYSFNNGRSYTLIETRTLHPDWPTWENYPWVIPATDNAGVSLCGRTVRIRIQDYDRVFSAQADVDVVCGREIAVISPGRGSDGAFTVRRAAGDLCIRNTGTRAGRFRLCTLSGRVVLSGLIAPGHSEVIARERMPAGTGIAVTRGFDRMTAQAIFIAYGNSNR